MMWSKYTYQFVHDGHYFLYNTLSNSLAEIDEESYADIKKGREMGTFPISDIESERLLRQLKVIVENDKDEINAIKYQTLLKRNDNRRLILTINPTLACNFACPYCFETSHPNVYMSDKVEDDIIRFILSRKEAKAIHVTWFGGEPLLAFNRIVSLTKKMQALGLEYSAGMITNGYLLTEKVASLFPSLKIASIQISLDGTAEIHDKRRCLKNGGPTFEKILSNINTLRKTCPDILVNIRVNVDKTNHEDFLKVYRIFQEKKDPKIRVNLAFVKDASGCKTCTSFFDTEQQALFAKEVLDNYGLDFSLVYPLSERYECAIRNRNSIVIGPEGELYKCWNDVGNKDKTTGNIDGRITNKSLWLRYIVGADPFEDANCKKCFFLPICGGGCPHSRLQNEYEGTSIDTCLFIKKHLKEFLISQINYKKKFQK